MLQNAYLDAKIGFDTAENEPSKVRGFLTGVDGGHPIIADSAVAGASQLIAGVNGTMLS